MSTSHTQEITSPAAPSPPEDRKRPEDIRAEIDRTRGEMDATIDALTQRFHPRHLMDDLLDYFRSSPARSRIGQQQAADSARQMGQTLATQVRQHPISSALIGAGLAYLFFEQRSHRPDEPTRAYPERQPTAPESRPEEAVSATAPETQERQTPPRRYPSQVEPPMHSGSYVDARTGMPYDESYGAEWRQQAEAESRAGVSETAMSMRPQMGRQFQEARTSVRERAGQWTAHAQESAGRLRDRIRTRSTDLKTGAGQARERMMHRMHDGYAYGRGRFMETLENHPLPLGAAFAAFGLCAGLLFPRTRREDEVFGEASDKVKQQAMDTGRELQKKGQQVAQATISAAAGEAEKQGISMGQMGEKVQRVANEARGTATSEAEKEGLNQPSVIQQKAAEVDRQSDGKNR